MPMIQTQAEIAKILRSRIPPSALQYGLSLWEGHLFELKLAKQRKTKLGDYRFDPRTNDHTITVNENLGPYEFLITYLHEFAHLLVIKKHGRKVNPHGSEWKSAFRDVMLPVLNDSVFPDAILRVLARHMKNPKASSSADIDLVRVLRGEKDELCLDDISSGQLFLFREVLFKKLQTKRTRVVCEKQQNKKKYLIPRMAPVTQF